MQQMLKYLAVFRLLIFELFLTYEFAQTLVTIIRHHL